MRLENAWEVDSPESKQRTNGEGSAEARSRDELGLTSEAGRPTCWEDKGSPWRHSLLGQRM